MDLNDEGIPKIGDIAQRSKKLSIRDIELYKEIFGNQDPLEKDAVRPGASGSLVVQGGVTSGLLNALVAEDIPGPGTVFIDLNLQFTKPAYVGDTITASVRVVRARTDRPICILDVEVRNSSGALCLSGVATTYTAAAA